DLVTPVPDLLRPLFDLAQPPNIVGARHLLGVRRRHERVVGEEEALSGCTSPGRHPKELGVKRLEVPFRTVVYDQRATTLVDDLAVPEPAAELGRLGDVAAVRRPALPDAWPLRLLADPRRSQRVPVHIGGDGVILVPPLVGHEPESAVDPLEARARRGAELRITLSEFERDAATVAIRKGNQIPHGCGAYALALPVPGHRDHVEHDVPVAVLEEVEPAESVALPDVPSERL